MRNKELPEDILTELKINEHDKSLQENMVDNYKTDFAAYLKNTNIDLKQIGKTTKIKKPVFRCIREFFSRLSYKISNII